MEAPTGGQSTAFVYEDWADLGRSDIAAPLPWALASRCVHIAGGIGSNGGVLAVQLGEGDAASAVCVKQFDAKKVRPDMEMLAAHLLRAARVRAPLARYATQAEIDDEIAPAVGKAYFEGGGSWACPRLCMQAMFEQPAIVAKLGLPDKLVDEWRDKWQAERAQKRVAIEAGEERAEAIAVIEFVRGPTLLQGGGGALGEAEYEALGRLAAFDVLLNNFDRLPVLFDNEGNLANVMLERREGGGVTCCAIDSCVNPLRGAAREKYLRWAQVHPPLHTQPAASTLAAREQAAALRGAGAGPGAGGSGPRRRGGRCTAPLPSPRERRPRAYGSLFSTPAPRADTGTGPEPDTAALRRGWAGGLADIAEMARGGALAAALESFGAEAALAGADRDELDAAAGFVTEAPRRSQASSPGRGVLQPERRAGAMCDLRDVCPRGDARVG